VTAPACVPNIGPAERRKRLRFGLGAWAVALGGLAILLGTDAPRAWRLALLLPFWGGALGFLQHREKT
jgi:hypothetical protein